MKGVIYSIYKTSVLQELLFQSLVSFSIVLLANHILYRIAFRYIGSNQHKIFVTGGQKYLCFNNDVSKYFWIMLSFFVVSVIMALSFVSVNKVLNFEFIRWFDFMLFQSLIFLQIVMALKCLQPSDIDLIYPL